MNQHMTSSFGRRDLINTLQASTTKILDIHNIEYIPQFGGIIIGLKAEVPEWPACGPMPRAGPASNPWVKMFSTYH